MKKKVALITGITGQDGSILAKFLLKKNYIVHGIRRRTSSLNSNVRLDKIFQDKFIKNKTFFLHYGDILDSSFCHRIINETKPIEVYHLAAQSHVAISFEIPHFTTVTNTTGTLNFLEAIRQTNKKIRFYNASTSEMYGSLVTKYQDENTEFKPQSPYAISKLYSHLITKNYRESYNIFAANGILFNHESEDRGETFVTRKISKFVAKYSLKKQGVLYLGNMSSKRDWGYAKDYVQAMWLMLQKKIPEDYVIATNKSYSVKFFSDLVLKALKFNYKWVGKGINEKAIDKLTRKPLIKINKKFYRPAEVNFLKGSYKKAKNQLKWRPKTSIKELVKIMVDFELKNSSYKNS